MNLFTKYTPEETKKILEIAEKKIEIKHDIFTGVNRDKMAYFRHMKIGKKELLKEYDFVFLKKGKVGVVHEGKIVRTLKEGECFGFSKKFLGKDYVLLAIEESEVVLFDIGEDMTLAYNLLRYVSKHASCKIV